ncbi:BspA family leucine-rich repeat surface protein [Eggerthellaceae bacterium zg-1084]|uniref:putative Ig domain-containing protein n=1 Tax=Berryella wangjianweii TaxID=2734634 RepID=UPI0015552EA9|nr:putative Ig domain-containing protein [Berryella wangjianweii]NPD31045.1 BspA family leucine-rich repeat surface protein [Berryella wangjianweii]
MAYAHRFMRCTTAWVALVVVMMTSALAVLVSGGAGLAYANEPAAHSDAFVFTIDTRLGPAPHTSFTIKGLDPGHPYSVNADLQGTGHAVNPTATDVTGDYVCNFTEPGVYQIELRGDFSQMGFDPRSIGQLVSVDQWGDSRQWTAMNSMFRNAVNLTTVPAEAPDLSRCTSLKSMFEGAKKFNSPIGNWDTSHVTNMSAMLKETAFNQPIGNWDTSHVTDMSYMFNGARAFNQPLNDWDVSNVTRMTYMFGLAREFNQPLDRWNTGNVTTMDRMFNAARAFNQPIGNWDVSHVTDPTAMFENATSFNQPLNDWDTGSFTSLKNMFSKATSFNQPLDRWNTSNVTTMAAAFQGAGAFNQPIGNWDTSKVDSLLNMFNSASSFNQPIDSWDVSHVRDFQYMLSRATAFNQDLGAWNMASADKLEGALSSSGMSHENYEAALAGWAATVPDGAGKPLGANGLRYYEDDPGHRAIMARGWVPRGDIPVSHAAVSVDDATGRVGEAMSIPVTASQGEVRFETLPAGLSYDAERHAIVGTPEQPGEYTVTATVTNELGESASDTFAVLVKHVLPAIDSIDDQNGRVGEPVNIPVSARDGEVSVAGLPDGASYDPTTGAITGAPTQSGDFPVTVTVTNLDGEMVTTAFNLHVRPKAPTAARIDDQTGRVGEPVSVPVTAENGTVEVTGLPDGLSYDPATGSIAGTPTASGDFPVTVKVTNPEGEAATVDFNLHVRPKAPVAGDVRPPADARVGEPVSVPVTAENGAVEVEGLPDGLSYDPATGVVTGAPTQSGDFLVTVTVTNPEGEAATVDFNLHVRPKAPVAGDVQPPAGARVGDVLVIPVNTDNGTVEVEGLPDGLSYDPATGAATGAPTQSGDFPVTVTVTNEEGEVASNDFVIHVKPKLPTAARIDDQAGRVGEPVSVPVTAENGTVEVTGLPDGLGYDPATGAVTGVPTQSGDFPVTVTVTNEEGETATATFNLHVKPKAPTAARIDDQVGRVGEPVSVPVTAENGTVEVTGLPDGLGYDPATGAVTGVPTQSGDFPVTVTVTNEEGETDTSTFNLHVKPKAPTAARIDDQTGRVGEPVGVPVNAENGTVEVTGLPDGLSYDPATGSIAGTPTASGDFPVTVTVTNEEGETATATFNLHVRPKAPVAGDVRPPADARVGEPVSVPVTAENGTVEVEGLPDGLSYDPATGSIAGTPTESGDFLATVTVTNAEGEEDASSFNLHVRPKAPVAGDVQPPAEVRVGDVLVIPMSADNGTVEVEGLPDGLSYDPATGAVTGAPTESGDFPVAVTVTNAEGEVASGDFVIHVKPKLPTAARIDDQTGRVGEPVGIPVTADNGDVTVTSLPDGASYDPTTGSIAGTPTTPGDYAVTVTVTNSEGEETTTTFNLHVKPKAPTAARIGDQTGRVGDPVGVPVTAENGTVEVEGLPDGLSYDSATGSIAGTPTASGDFPVTVTVTNEEGETASSDFVIHVKPKLPTAARIDDQVGRVGEPVNIPVSARDGEVSVAGLPDGASYDPTTGAITGAPTQSGDFPVTVTVTNLDGEMVTTAFNLHVKPKAPVAGDVRPPADARVGEPVGVPVTAENGTVEVTGLPDGLGYDPATGSIAGTPTTPGDYAVTVTVTNSEGEETTTTFHLPIKPKYPTLDEVNVPSGARVGEPVGVPVTAENGTVEVEGLPDGLSYDPATGTITGTPTTAGDFPVTVTVTNSAGEHVERTFNLPVRPIRAQLGDIGDQVGRLGDPFTLGIESQGGEVAVSGLPAGLSYDSASGSITGTPEVTGSFAVTVTATNAIGETTEKSFTLTVRPKLPVLGQVQPPMGGARMGDTVDIPVSAENGSVTVSGLPDGVTYDPTTGRITGAPTAPGDFSVVITVTNEVGEHVERTIDLAVKPKLPTLDDIEAPAPIYEGESVNIPVRAHDGAVTVTGLPDGLGYDPATGTIVGAPTQRGTFAITVTATNSDGEAVQKTISLVIEPRPADNGAPGTREDEGSSVGGDDADVRVEVAPHGAAGASHETPAVHGTALPTTGDAFAIAGPLTLAAAGVVAWASRRRSKESRS